jgi:protein PhnA
MESNPSPPCPKCQSPYAYQDQHLWICPECAFEWSTQASEHEPSDNEGEFRDINGVQLSNGDSVSVAKDLKLKGKDSIKSGTKVKNIRLLEGPVNGHDISCKIPGHGQVYLKCSVVKKI